MGVRDEYSEGWAAFLRTVNETELLSTARDFIWLAEFGPEAGRDTFTVRRDGVIAELQNRGMLEELREIQRELGENVSSGSQRPPADRSA